MKRFIALTLLIVTRTAVAQTSLTIYNQNFAVVREPLKLKLQVGTNEVRQGHIADYVEPTSVILRDLSGAKSFSVLEQSFDNASLSQDGMLSAFEGQTVDFLRHDFGKSEVIQGKIIRAGQSKNSGSDQPAIPPIVEVGGKRQFELPGTPQFPTTGQPVDSKPEFIWKVSAPKAGEFSAEVAYVTYAIDWWAEYNVVAAENGDDLQLTGWITLDNKTGIGFGNARAKFIAGLVEKLSPPAGATIPFTEASAERAVVTGSNIPTPEAKALEAYYAFTFPTPISIKNNDKKQFQFLSADGVRSKRIYTYDGANDIPYRYASNPELDPQKGVDSFSTVSIAREFKNSSDNHLGTPLPQGRMRFYLRTSDQQLEFVGEMDVPSTPKDENVRAILGQAFDLVAQRNRTDFNVDLEKKTVRESYEIKLRNHKTEPVEIRVVEHLFRWSNWDITAKSDPFVKKNSGTIEFTVSVKPNEEHLLSYTVLYTKFPVKAESVGN